MNPLDLRWQMVRDRWPVRVKNGAGASIPPFSLVLISSSTATNNDQVHTVVKPNASSTDFNRGNYLVTGPFTIGSGSSNEGLATSLTQPNYMSVDGTAAKGQIWGPKHGQFTASRYYYGFEIQGHPTTFNGVNIALSKWVGVTSVTGKTDASVTAGSTVTVSVYNGATAGSETDTSANITSVYLRTGYVPSSCFVRVEWDGELPYIVDDHKTVIGKADSNISKGSTGTFSVYNNGSDTTDNLTVSALGAALTSAKWATAWYEEKSGTWYGAPWEC